MSIKIEITHNGHADIYEVDGFEDAWKALMDVGYYWPTTRPPNFHSPSKAWSD